MTERELDLDSQPRKRIAVAVSSTETNFRNGHEGSDFAYNLDAARPYSNQARVTVSPLSSISQYATDTGDVISPYRQNQYSYGGKGFLSPVPGFAYQDDGVDYGINYSQPMLGHDQTYMLGSYARYSAKAMSVSPEAAYYAYGDLVRRPAVTSESPTGFSLSGMAASLPSDTDRVDTAERLLPQVNRTLTGGSSSYRADGLPSYSSAKTSPTTSMPEVGYPGMSSSYDSPYSAPITLPSSIPHRSSSQHDGSSFQSSSSSGSDPLYSSTDSSLRSADDSNSGLSYIYSDKLEGARREPQSNGGTNSESVLPNGHIYVPDSHTHGPPPSSSQSYGSSQGSVSSAVGVDGSATSSRGSRSSGSSHMHSTDGHRRSAGNLRG
ncbi:hypothetical protein GGR53DRAFT_527346 [Hypoxylon sp. FL1150]|nr:hypothetical protein GGR53DRAFT_527346 [Hypoxylon sp. FL1150]